MRPLKQFTTVTFALKLLVILLIGASLAALGGAAQQSQPEGCPFSLEGIIEDFETRDFSKFPWRANNWVITSSRSHSGRYSAAQKEPENSLEITLNVGSGSISFYRLSDDNRGLRFYIDGSLAGGWDSLKGSWVRETFFISAGVHTFRWEGISSDTDDTDVYIDDIAFPPPGPGTIGGSPSDDTLIGTESDETICGFGGNDRIFGGAGDDRLFGGPGDDFIDGGTGSDYIEGEEGNDTILGGDDGDTLIGGKDVDYIIAGAGDDVIILRRGDVPSGRAEDLVCGSGTDTIILKEFPSLTAFPIRDPGTGGTYTNASEDCENVILSQG